ncbi:TonB-dependent receptor [Vibrio sp. SCSIO 43135]|uniref:TonB-dependent receptor plug domain-containing protein n=1 Tax=Vibrio sp. SCSIO 43135 TaxID=2819096 RepID=UPI002074CC1D|nr:TonB-dependent receptor [Vibrio sp. SCSIO 43135]USD43968.1 TonB-dependent receptor [Vibrio sp. SCSIO 43135]
MKYTLLTSLFLSLVSRPVLAEESALEHLMSMSLEELSLLQIEMQTASKYSQQLTDIPSSVYVLESDRIQRSGATTIAQALALVPGLNVSMFSQTEPMVSSRGFHDGLYNKMLVMIDGRSLFSPVYGGVYWSDVDYILPDIDRIEVLRGPGGAMWGGNAVNGVINIITKSTQDTLGTFVKGAFADNGDYITSVRHGLQLNESVTGRAFYKRRDEKRDFSSDAQHWLRESAGVVLENEEQWTLRFGGEQSKYDRTFYQVQYENGQSQGLTSSEGDVASHSAYVQLNTEHELSESVHANSMIALETNKDEALDAPGTYTTFDIEANFVQDLEPTQIVSYGFAYRYVAIDFGSEISDVDFNNIDYFIRAFSGDSTRDSIASAYIQSDKFWTESFKTVFGIKGEYFEHTSAFELSPQARALYQVSDNQSFWAGIGRSATAPSYIETNSYYFNNYPQGDAYWIAGYYPQPDMSPEIVTTYELGYRYLSAGLELDATVFYSQHDNVRGQDFIGYHPDYYQVDVNVTTDDYSLDSHGLELAAQWPVRDWFKVFGTYTYFSAQGEWDGGQYSTGESKNLYTVEHQHLATVQGLFDINPQWQFDFLIRAQEIEYAQQYEQVPNFIAVDLRLAWQKHSHAPLFEAIVKNLGEKEGYTQDWMRYTQEQLAYLRVSYEF